MFHRRRLGIDFGEMTKRSHLIDLPDEILLLLFKELPMLEVLCIFTDVYEWLNRIAHDSLYFHHLDLTGLSADSPRCHRPFSAAEEVQLRLCETVHPLIHDQVHRIIVKSDSMKAILAAANYPQLYSLSIENFKVELLHHCFTGLSFR